MISVIMSVYNERVEWLKAATESILHQTYKDFEFIIIVDNPELENGCNEYLQKVAASDERILIHRNSQNIGLAKSLNVGISLSKGEFIARMDADDISLPDRLKVELETIKSHKVDMVSSTRIDIEEDGTVIGNPSRILSDPYSVLPYSNIVVHPSVMMRTEVLKELGGYRPFYNSEDYDLWLRMLSAGYRIEIIETPLIYYRTRQTSMSKKNMVETYYITKYQQKLYKQRMKNGYDSFSEDAFLRYMESKDCSEYRNNRYTKFRAEMDAAIQCFKRKSPLFIMKTIKAFALDPVAGLDTFAAVVRLSLKH